MAIYVTTRGRSSRDVYCRRDPAAGACAAAPARDVPSHWDRYHTWDHLWHRTGWHHSPCIVHVSRQGKDHPSHQWRRHLRYPPSATGHGLSSHTPHGSRSTPLSLSPGLFRHPPALLFLIPFVFAIYCMKIRLSLINLLSYFLLSTLHFKPTNLLTYQLTNLLTH